MSGVRREHDGPVGAPRAGAVWRWRGHARRPDAAVCRGDRDRALSVVATAVRR
ncbi:hypothetical protein [Micromonospora sp. NPDC049801]|uniref:hypothetical protein n=1 Tax=unclassified Micromonospora TaxID=2617518 RepID=UPI0033E50F0A